MNYPLAMTVLFASILAPLNVAFGDDLKSRETESSETKSPEVTSLELESLPGRTFPARDSLAALPDPSADAQECLDGLCWEPGPFTVHCESSDRRDRGDILVRFPSPRTSGDRHNDLVAMEWYIARDDQSRPKRARAVVVVHESGSGMKVGRLIARSLRIQGLHTFMIHLPHYGERRTENRRPQDANIVQVIEQSVADVRRARDAVAALPMVDTSHIALQGTSLGGIVSATSGSLDKGYNSVHLLVAGGDLYGLIQNGRKEAAQVREAFAKAGLTGKDLRELAHRVEPTRIAHRLDPQRTWLYSGTLDTVIPPRNSLALARAAHLDEDHHIQMLANHVTGIIYLPMVLGEIQQRVTTLD